MIRSILMLITCMMVQPCLALSSLHFKRDGNSQDYKVKRLFVEINVVEDLTYTTITADFFHDSYRNQEAELIIPLSKNATICEYAIDVNGKMKEASVVEKNIALNAYESIKARNVDPGIVEKKANHLYRIRVFPLLHNKVKRLKISYVTKSDVINGFYRYRLPIKLEKFIESATIKITRSNKNSVIKNTHLGLNEANQFTNEIVSRDLTDVIEIVTPITKTNTVIVRDGDEENRREAYYKIVVPQDMPLKKLYCPERVTILWDNSAPFSPTLQQRQFKLLDKYFKRNQNTQIQLYAIGYELQDLGTFKINNGNWSDMKKVIAGLKYDGAMNFSSTLGIKVSHLEQDVFLFSQRHLVSKLQFKKLPRQQHLIDLKKDKTAQVLDAISYQRLLPLNKAGMQVKAIHETDSRVLKFIGYGVFNDNFSIGYKHEKKPLFTARFNGRPEAKIGKKSNITTSYLSKILARHQLDALLKQGASEQEIIEHARKHRLVSDYTSMIVLETMEDHIRYRIPPRDPKELAEYTKGMEKISGKPLMDYNRKINYHKHRFPWHNYPFKKALLSIDIWDICLERFFLPKQVDQKSHQYVMQWKKRVKATNFDLQSCKTQPEFKQRLGELKKLDDIRKNFFSVPSKYPKNKDITVSLRGLVKNPRNHTLKAGTDLKEFVFLEEGVLIDLYRNSQRYTFNIYSKEYKKTPLQSGDMIVVNTVYGLHPNTMVEGIRELRKYPYILSRGTNLDKFHYDSGDSEGGDPFSEDSDPFDSSSSSFDQAPIKTQPEKKVVLKGQFKSLKKMEPWKLTKDLWKKFEDEIEAKPQQAYTSYLALKKHGDLSSEFFIRVATIFYQHKLKTIARKVLSNIMATEEASTAAQKRYLYWLMHFNDFEFALKKIQQFDPNLSNDDFKFIHFTILQQTDQLEKIDLKKLATINHFSYHLDTIAAKSPLLTNPPSYDIRIVASAETNGISDFIKTVYTSPIDPENSTQDLYKHGFFSDIKQGIEEHTMKKAMPGHYEISVSNKIIATYRVEIYKHWKTPQQTKKIITIHTNGKGGWKKIHQLAFTLPK